MMRFTGTDRYLATDDRKLAVNAAVGPRRPPLAERQRGAGKAGLAREIAVAPSASPIERHVRSTTRGGAAAVRAAGVPGAAAGAA